MNRESHTAQKFQLFHLCLLPNEDPNLCAIIIDAIPWKATWARKNHRIIQIVCMPEKDLMTRWLTLMGVCLTHRIYITRALLSEERKLWRNCNAWTCYCCGKWLTVRNESNSAMNDSIWIPLSKKKNPGARSTTRIPPSINFRMSWKDIVSLIIGINYERTIGYLHWIILGWTANKELDRWDLSIR